MKLQKGFGLISTYIFFETNKMPSVEKQNFLIILVGIIFLVILLSSFSYIIKLQPELSF